MSFIRSGGFRILLGGVVALALMAGVGAYLGYRHLAQDLPDIQRLDDYAPAVVSEVLDRNGQLIGEFSTERRRLVEVEDIPDHVKLAFVSAEDNAFFEHWGVDLRSIARAAWANLRAGGEIRQGASTITQQMVKSLLLSPERTYTRKLREAILAVRIEQSLSKDEILYLYLNQIYFGQGAWGIGEAARSYFGKQVRDLSVSEAALLAGLPQRPSQYSPFRNPELAENRRRYVLGRMLADEVIDPATYELALASPPELAPPENGDDFWVSSYFTEQVRRQLFDELGGELVLEGGLTIETTMDLALQRTAVEAVRSGLRDQDRRAGYRGPIRRIAKTQLVAELAKLAEENDLPLAEGAEAEASEVAASPEDSQDGPGGQGGEEGEAATDDAIDLPSDRPLVGVVVAVDERDQSAEIAFGPGVLGRVHLEDVSWARPPDPRRRSRTVKEIAQIFAEGDVARFVRLDASEREAPQADDGPASADAEAPLPFVGIFQEPNAQAALLSLEVRTGDVISIVGGYDYGKSQYNRATQALRQPGSAFKPIIYGAALSQGYTPVSTLYDRPIVYVDPVSGFKYKPQNYERRFFGPIPMRYALAHSINNATVHLFRDVGVDYVIDYARQLGIEAPLERDLSLAIGSSSVTLLELTAAYAVFANQGRRVVPRFVTRVVDREGNVLIENLPLGGTADPEAISPLPAVSADADAPGDGAVALAAHGGPSDPVAADGESEAEQVIPESVAYLMCDLMKAVVSEGTGRRLKSMGGYLAGKTGTTNDFVDAWYMGFSSELVTGVWVGHDQRQRLGWGESGARAALPIWRDYMAAALRRYPVRDFAVPDDIVFRSIDRATGLLADGKTKDAYFQPFVEDTAPTETSSQVSSAEDTHSRVRDDAF